MIKRRNKIVPISHSIFRVGDIVTIVNLTNPEDDWNPYRGEIGATFRIAEEVDNMLYMNAEIQPRIEGMCWHSTNLRHATKEETSIWMEKYGRNL